MILYGLIPTWKIFQYLPTAIKLYVILRDALQYEFSTDRNIDEHNIAILIIYSSLYPSSSNYEFLWLKLVKLNIWN